MYLKTGRYFFDRNYKKVIYEKKFSAILELSIKKISEATVKHNLAAIVFYMIAPLIKDKKILLSTYTVKHWYRIVSIVFRKIKT